MLRSSRRHRRRQNIGKPAQLTLLGAATVITGVLVALALQPPAPPSEATAGEPVQIVTDEPTTIAVIGDSNTEVDSVDFAAGNIGPKSWVQEFTRGDYRFVGGWADGGANTARIAAELAPTKADVLLVMAGTNDVGLGVPFEQTAANLEAAIDKADAERVVLLAIPPREPETTPSSAQFNASLAAFAADNGWEYFDGHAGTVLEDGVHMDAPSNRAFAQAVIGHLEG